MRALPSMLFVISYDAYAEAAVRIAAQLKQHGACVRFLLLTRHGSPFFSDARLQAVTDMGPVAYAEESALAQTLTQSDAGVMFLFFAGPVLEQTIRALHAGRAPAPVCVTCFAGLTHYRQHIGFTQRLTSDIILFNSARNLRDYEAFCKKVKASPANGLLLGFPALLGLTPRALSESVKHVVYIDQSIIPAMHAQRHQLAAFLLAYARKFPQREVKLLCRETAQNRSVHPPKFHLETLIREHARDSMPANIIISTETPESALAQCDLCIGIASTVLVHAIARGIRTAVLGDFGWKNRLGNRVFVGSGLETNMARLLRDDYPNAPQAAWLDENIARPETHIDALLATLHDAPPIRMLNVRAASRLARRARYLNAPRRLAGRLKRRFCK